MKQTQEVVVDLPEKRKYPRVVMFDLAWIVTRHYSVVNYKIELNNKWNYSPMEVQDRKNNRSHRVELQWPGQEVKACVKSEI